jgi:hypothetical protein
MILTVQSLVAFARSVQGEDLVTLQRRRPFKVVVSDSTFEFTPRSSSQARIEHFDRVESILARFSRTGSFQPTNYTNESFNASYVLALIQKWQAAQ